MKLIIKKPLWITLTVPIILLVRAVWDRIAYEVLQKFRNTNRQVIGLVPITLKKISIALFSDDNELDLVHNTRSTPIYEIKQISLILKAQISILEEIVYFRENQVIK